MSRLCFYLWCILVVSSSHRHIGYGARTDDPRRSLNLSEDLHRIQSPDASRRFNQDPLNEYSSVEQFEIQSNKRREKRNDSAFTISRNNDPNDGNAICRKKNNDIVEWSCTEIASCNVSKESQSATQQTVCGKEGSSQKICCPYTIPAVIVAREKCREYSEFRYINVTIPPVTLDDEPFIRRTLDCPYENQILIVGGEPAVEKEFPHMALIGYEKKNHNITWECGGSLISPEYVLSAAHCNDLHKKSVVPTLVVLGLLTRPSDAKKISKDNLYRIQNRINHPEYRSTESYHDIALFKLERPVVLNSVILPLCLALPQDVELTTYPVTATGWGLTSFDGSESNVLLKVNLNRFKESECVKTYRRSNKLSKGINATTMICAGRSDANKDTCSGDSGGPLQSRIYDKKDYKCMWLLEGITSFGPWKCGNNKPAVYTRVQPFLSWIQPIVWPTQDLKST